MIIASGFCLAAKHCSSDHLRSLESDLTYWLLYWWSGEAISRASAERDKSKHDPRMSSSAYVAHSYGKVQHNGAGYCFRDIILTH